MKINDQLQKMNYFQFYIGVHYFQIILFQSIELFLNVVQSVRKNLKFFHCCIILSMKVFFIFLSMFFIKLCKNNMWVVLFGFTVFGSTTTNFNYGSKEFFSVSNIKSLFYGNSSFFLALHLFISITTIYLQYLDKCDDIDFQFQLSYHLHAKNRL